MKLWIRYLFLELCKVFVFLLFCIFAIYTIFDLSINGIRFISGDMTTSLEIVHYYLNNFANHLDFFFPLTFLLASLKVLFDLHGQNGLVALQMAGISSKKILSPFFTFALFLTLISYANHEWVMPTAQESSDAFKKKHYKHKKTVEKKHVYSVSLEDDSEIIYQSFDQKKKELFDVFWMKTPKDFWHIKYLSLAEDLPRGRFVDHFQKVQEIFEKTESFDTHLFTNCSLCLDVELQKFIPFENRSLSALYKQSIKHTSERIKALCYLYHKLATPLISFFILALLSPKMMQYNRVKPIFLIVATSIVLFIGFMIVLDGMLILAENQVLPSIIAIWGPVTLLAIVSFQRFFRGCL